MKIENKERVSDKLPVADIFLKAIVFPFNDFRRLVKVALPLAIVWVFYTFIIRSFVDQAGIHTVEDYLRSHFYLMLVFWLVILITMVMAIVGCHRIILLEEDSTSIKFLNWTGCELNYIGWWIVLGFYSALAAVVYIFVSSVLLQFFHHFFSFSLPAIGPLEFVITLPFLYIVSRWSLILPSAAVGIQGKPPRWSWNQSTGNGWRLTILIACLPIALDTMFELLPSYNHILYDLIHGALWLIVGAIEIALLSLSYQFLVNKQAAVE